MIEVDWNEAPEWANFVTQDECGAIWWHEDKPVAYVGGWQGGVWDHGGRTKLAVCMTDWKYSLKKRPGKKKIEVSRNKYMYSNGTFVRVLCIDLDRFKYPVLAKECATGELSLHTITGESKHNAPDLNLVERK